MNPERFQKACEFDNIPPTAKFVVFSKDNPYGENTFKMWTYGAKRGSEHATFRRMTLEDVRDRFWCPECEGKCFVPDTEPCHRATMTCDVCGWTGSPVVEFADGRCRECQGTCRVSAPYLDETPRQKVCPLCHANLKREIWFIANDGTARRAKVTGRLKTWKRDPARFQLSIKYGHYEYARFDNADLPRMLVRCDERD